VPRIDPNFKALSITLKPIGKTSVGATVMINRLTDALNFQTQALSLRAERQQLLASNIANADTPGFQARDFNFAAALREASSAQAKGLAPAVARTEAQLRWALPAQTNLDRSTVDMDRERAAFSENALKYDAALRFINGSVRTLQEAMRSHQQG
jgi:flagellar basal-body rod protein FlgB